MTVIRELSFHADGPKIIHIPRTVREIENNAFLSNRTVKKVKFA